jgi:hypothetical protein
MNGVADDRGRPLIDSLALAATGWGLAVDRFGREPKEDVVERRPYITQPLRNGSRGRGGPLDRPAKVPTPPKNLRFDAVRRCADVCGLRLSHTTASPEASPYLQTRSCVSR